MDGVPPGGSAADAANAYAALKAAWAKVCNELRFQLPAPAVGILKVTYGVDKPLPYLAESDLFTGRNVVAEASLLKNQLEDYRNLPVVYQSLTAYIKQAKKLFAQYPALRDSLPGERISQTEAELCRLPHPQHWAIVLTSLKAGLPSAAYQPIKSSRSMFNDEENVFDLLAPMRLFDDDDKSNALKESRALFSVLGYWSGRPEVAMLGAYVRRLARECDGKPALPPAQSATPRSLPKGRSQPQAVIQAENEALFFNTNGRLQSAFGAVPATIRQDGWAVQASAVGRVNIKGGVIDGSPSTGFHAGTAWHIGNNLVVTAAHVANDIFDPYGGFPWNFQPGQSSTTTTIDFGVIPGGPTAHVRRLLAKGRASVPDQVMYTDDVAVMEIAWSANAQPNIPALTIAAEARVAATSRVAVLGYPAPGGGTVEVMQGMSGVYGTKRLQPGEVVQALDLKDFIWHTCSTLCGNSGSPLFSLQNPDSVIGLHVGADYLNGLLYNVASPLTQVTKFVMEARTIVASEQAVANLQM